MSLIETLNGQIIDTMKLKAKDPTDANVALEGVYKSVKAKATAIAKEAHSDITDAIVVQAAKKEIKELDQTLALAPEDSKLWSDATIQKSAISTFVPAELSDEELERRVRAIIMVQPAGANFGIKMRACMAELKDVADGKRIKSIIEKIG